MAAVIERLVLLIAAAVVVAGCGNSATKEGSSPSTTFRAYVSALASGHGTAACGALTGYARARATEHSGKDCRALVHDLHEKLATRLTRLRETHLRITSLDGRSAEGTATLGTRRAFAAFAKAGSRWRLDSPNVARLLLAFGGSAHL